MPSLQHDFLWKQNNYWITITSTTSHNFHHFRLLQNQKKWKSKDGQENNDRERKHGDYAQQPATSKAEGGTGKGS